MRQEVTLGGPREWCREQIGPREEEVRCKGYLVLWEDVENEYLRRDQACDMRKLLLC